MRFYESEGKFLDTPPHESPESDDDHVYNARSFGAGDKILEMPRKKRAAGAGLKPAGK